MSGSIRERGINCWEMRVFLGTDPLSGRKRYATRTVRGSRTEAQRELLIFAAVANVAPIVGARSTVADLLERWFVAASPNWAPTTVRSVRSIISCQLLPGLGSIRVRELTTVDIDEFYGRLRTDGRHDGKALSVGAVRRVHSVLHRVLAQAMRWDWIWINPASNASPPRSVPSDVRPPTAAEVQALLVFAASRDLAFHTFLVLAASTGARRSQLLGLRWSDIDLSRGAIGFRRGLVDGVSGPVLVSTKTRRTYRVELDGVTLAVLRDHHAKRSEILADSFVFCSGGDAQQPWKPNWVTKKFISTRIDAGLAHFRLHDLRHFMATGMLNLGVPVPIVAARLCHARASTTLNVYAHAVPSGDRAAAELFASVWRQQQVETSAAA